MWSHELRDRYRAMAGAYTALAETELVLVKYALTNHPPAHDKAEQPRHG